MVWGALIQQISGHVSSGARGLFSYVSAKKQAQSAGQMMADTAAASLVDMSMELARQRAATRAMKRTLRQIDAAYGEGDDPRAQRTRRIIRRMVGDLGGAAAAPAAERAVEGVGARRLALRRAAAVGPGGSALGAQERRTFRADVLETQEPVNIRNTASYDATQAFAKERQAARGGAVDLGGETADISPPLDQIQRLGAFRAARGQTMAKYGPSVAQGVQSSIENVLSAYLEHQSQSRLSDSMTRQQDRFYRSSVLPAATEELQPAALEQEAEVLLQDGAYSPTLELEGI